MASSFFKEERVAFTNMVKAFEDQLAYGQAATLFDELTPAEMVYTRDRVWVDTPMIGSSYDGFDQTSNFDGLTELVVPASVGFHKASPKVLSSKNLRNERAMTRWMDSAKAKLASDVNAAVRRRVALEAAIFTKRTVAPTGFDDLAVSPGADGRDWRSGRRPRCLHRHARRDRHGIQPRQPSDHERRPISRPTRRRS
ncbi:P22 phage major capsid protein family protein [Sphingomonas sp. R86520]|uniref:P22 phage major capsid protein family protein n=1 Tax=Sphingomonas sp. R86520 TaxID=3093859 RepID=UPI0036D34F18